MSTTLVRASSGEPASIVGRPTPPWTSVIAAGGASWSLNALTDDAGRTCLTEALDGGVTCIDTAGAYTRAGASHHNERLIGDALNRRFGRAHRSSGGDRGLGRPLVVTKSGHHRTGATTWDVDARPATLRRDVQGSLQALGTEALDVCLLHWPDPTVPLQDSVDTLVQMQREGLIAHVGISNVSVEQLRAVLAPSGSTSSRGSAVSGISVLQTRLSALEAVDAETAQLLTLCRDNGVVVMGYAPFGGPGRLAEALRSHPGGPAGRAEVPLLIAQLAQDWGQSVHFLLLSWLLRSFPGVTPVVGSTRPNSIRDAAAAAAGSVALRGPGSGDVATLTTAQHLELSVAVADRQRGPLRGTAR